MALNDGHMTLTDITSYTDSGGNKRPINLSNYYSELIGRLSRPLHSVMKPDRVRLILSYFIAVVADAAKIPVTSNLLFASAVHSPGTVNRRIRRSF